MFLTAVDIELVHVLAESRVSPLPDSPFGRGADIMLAFSLLVKATHSRSRERERMREREREGVREGEGRA